MTVHRQAAVGFQRTAELYERSRPGYPARLVRWLVERMGIGPDRIVVDLAAGTGKLTRLLYDTGATVIAVEPVAAMLGVLRTATAGRVPAVAATAQALPFAARCVDAITVAQAFHWFATPDALGEMARVLRPDGHIALVWNRRLLDDPLQAELSTILDPYRGDTPSHHDDRWRQVIDNGRLMVADDRFEVENVQALDIDGLVERVTSTSFIASLPEDARRRVEARVRGLEDRFGPAPVMRYRCEAHLLTPSG